MKRKSDKQQGRRSRGARARGRTAGPDDIVRIYGLHAAEHALANKQRDIRRIYATPNAAQRLGGSTRAGLPEITQVSPRDLDRMLGNETVHQGILVEAAPLAEISLETLETARLVLVLDQITDPHNVGAILRSAAAFGVDALVMTTHHSPPLQTALAKAASGGLEHVPVLLVPNLSRFLGELGEMGFTRLGLDSGGDCVLETVETPDRLALVLGAEDRGLRRLTRENCEAICALTAFGPIVSLNVSNAAAIALHLMACKMKNRPEG
ncbi:MAG TPA: 23S rRNA (guanosine(2251)-2'-O)-methyltransferase RlmB [Hyphomicrobiales bacterium]|nr:23S rRNA (guanosine(2251)-2'-O)-methyltransferase RlmB [Hyphomicrobiales bacterium]